MTRIKHIDADFSFKESAVIRLIRVLFLSMGGTTYPIITQAILVWPLTPILGEYYYPGTREIVAGIT